MAIPEVRAPAGVTPVEAIRWSEKRRAVRIIDQRRLPGELVERDIDSISDMVDAIRTLAVRGAPAIGVAAAMALAAVHGGEEAAPVESLRRAVIRDAELLRAARPTAVNLPWAMSRMRGVAERDWRDAAALREALRREADAIREEDRAMCRRIGEHGLALVPDNARVLTHCNAGALATAGIGTALAPLYLAADAGRRLEVFVGETRPLRQGARLTAWELERAGIPVTVMADSMAASLMRAGRIDLVIVGADRIAANGDAANKIGTYALAVAAHHHGIPFYVAAPSSTFDTTLADGDGIPIEQRAGDELSRIGDEIAAPDRAAIYNPAFDVTPAELITAIISDRGIHRPPYRFAGA